MAKKKIIKENSNSPKGHGPGPGVFGVRNVGKVGNQAPPGAGKGVIGSKVGKVNPGKKE